MTMTIAHKKQTERACKSCSESYRGKKYPPLLRIETLFATCFEITQPFPITSFDVSNII